MRKIALIISLCLAVVLLASSCEQEVHTHTWDAGVVTARPSCVSIGAMTYTCTVCGETRVEILDMVDHTPGEAKTVAATCQKAGYSETACTVCGKVLNHTDIPMTDHVHGEVQTVQPTCTEGGYSRTVCTICGEEVIFDETEALGHSFAKAATLVEPTCETPGTDRYVCSVCHQTEIRTSDPLGHDFGEPIERIEPTCTSKGSEYKRCSRCDLASWEEIPMADHTWNEGEVTTFPTCTALGVKTYTCTHCTATKTEDVPMIEHSYVFGSTVTPSTCVSKGSAIYSCLVCGHEETRETAVDPFNHVHVSWVDTTSPKLFSDGSQKEVCDDCHQETGETRPVSHLTRTGWWTSNEVEVDMGMEHPVYCSFWLNFTGENHISAEMLMASEDMGGTFIETEIDDDIVLISPVPMPEGWIAAFQIKECYDLGNDDGEYGIISDSADSFALGLYDAEGTMRTFTFTRASAAPHTHTMGGEAVPMGEGIHVRPTSCTEHDSFYLIEPCEFVDDFCPACGQEKEYSVELQDGASHRYEYATKSAGLDLPSPVHGNAWEIPGQGIYYEAGDTYHPTGDGDFLRSCTI